MLIARIILNFGWTESPRSIWHPGLIPLATKACEMSMSSLVAASKSLPNKAARIQQMSIVDAEFTLGEEERLITDQMG